MNLPGIKSTVYHGTVFLGEVEVFPTKRQNFQFPNNEIRISHLSPSSLRCPPLAILQAISPFSVPCKILTKPPSHNSLLARLHASCSHDSKTAAVVIGDQELHLVAMPSKSLKSPTFWCCSIQAGLYASFLGMLNLRCLAIVFDLDETLIVANTMKSFEDRIEALSRRIDSEIDPVRVSGMSVELKRYLEDKDLLKQYAETNTVSDNGRLVSALNEEVPSLPGTREAIARPVIRLPEKNVVLTRINPEICDTSVFVRLRPAWDDLRSYLTAKGRKRFDVYVCTMAERDYALEMWRLLDPEAHLICSNQLLDRVTCVRSGSRKSLLNVFQDGICHPRMAMVIDDRLQVWDDKDQHRVHVVPAFTPYYAPQAEMTTAVPILCVVRNVACNVRGGFFKEFDEKLLPRISELCYENDIWDLPYAPDVSDYLTSEDNCILPNNSKDAPISEGITGVEVERKLNRNANLGDGHTQNQSRFPHPYSGPGASSSTEQQGMWSSGLPSWDPQGNMNYHWQFVGHVFGYGQKVAAHAAQQTAQYDAAMARTRELEQERDEWQRRSGDWERKSGEWEAQAGEWQRKSCEYEQERDEAVHQRQLMQADLTQAQEALGTSTQTSLDLAAKVEKLQLDVVDSGKMVEKAFSLYEKLKNKYKNKKDKVLSPPQP